MGRLDNKVVFITGTAGGQGRAAALLFAKEGAHIIGCDVKVEDAEETVSLVEAQGGRMHSFGPVDLSDPDAAKGWIDNGLSRAGKIDVLYNNASALQLAFMPEMTQSVWSFNLRNELDLIFNTVNVVWPLFVRQGHGVIINTASVSAHRGKANIGQLAHCAAKGGLLALTRQLAAEGAKIGIRANSISPGGVMTATLEKVLPPELQLEYHRIHPLGRAGRPEDIAYCALYLASDEACWVTGSDFVIDGGVSSIL